MKTTKFQARDHPSATDDYLLPPSLLLEKTRTLGGCVLYVCVRCESGWVCVWRGRGVGGRMKMCGCVGVCACCVYVINGIAPKHRCLEVMAVKHRCRAAMTVEHRCLMAKALKHRCLALNCALNVVRRSPSRTDAPTQDTAVAYYGLCLAKVT